METIHNYVEALFASLPQTADILSIKEEMLTNLEEKLQVMLQNGMNENEATGTIIAGIGSVKELKQELGIRTEAFAAAESAGGDTSSNHQTRSFSVSPDILREYRMYRDKKMIMIAIAVACFILSPCMWILFETVTRSEEVSTFAFLLTITFGVVLCILANRHNDYYQRLIPAFQSDEIGHQSGLTGLFAGILFPLAIVAYLCLGLVWNLWHPGWIIFPICGLIMGMIRSIDGYRKES